MRLILASSSPRRHDLLRLLGLPFEVRTPDIDEDAVWQQFWHGPGSGRRAARRLALAKAHAVQPLLTDTESALIVAADTVVIHGDKVLGKPHDDNEAAHMLRRLSNNAHDVVTGVAIVRHPHGPSTCASARTQVRFGWLTDDEIAAYVATGEPRDKAGAYGIQGLGGLLVASVHGSYDNVVGLPLRLVYRLLRRHGVEVLSTHSRGGLRRLDAGQKTGQDVVR